MYGLNTPGPAGRDRTEPLGVGLPQEIAAMTDRICHLDEITTSSHSIAIHKGKGINDKQIKGERPPWRAPQVA